MESDCAEIASSGSAWNDEGRGVRTAQPGLAGARRAVAQAQARAAASWGFASTAGNLPQRSQPVCMRVLPVVPCVSLAISGSSWHTYSSTEMFYVNSSWHTQRCSKRVSYALNVHRDLPDRHCKRSSRSQQRNKLSRNAFSALRGSLRHGAAAAATASRLIHGARHCASAQQTFAACCGSAGA